MASVEVAAPSMPAPTSRLIVSEEQARKISVGEDVNLKVSGKVKGITSCSDKGKYEVEIESPKVAGYEDNSADKAMTAMKDM